MKEIHYFIPENREELEGLVGKNVRVSMMNLDSEVMVYFGETIDWLSNPTDEFIQQESEGSPLIESYLAHSNFSGDKVWSVPYHRITRELGDKGYKERLNMLQNNPGMWHETASVEATV